MSLVPSIQVLTASRLTLHNELRIPDSCWMVYAYYVQILDGRHSWQTFHDKNPYFFMTTEPNCMGFRRNADN